LRVYENRELGRIYGPKREEATESWSKLYNKVLYNFNSSPDIFERSNQIG
jgi:hypothetical protein